MVICYVVFVGSVVFHTAIDNCSLKLFHERAESIVLQLEKKSEINKKKKKVGHLHANVLKS